MVILKLDPFDALARLRVHSGNAGPRRQKEECRIYCGSILHSAIFVLHSAKILPPILSFLIQSGPE
jgi:hypothetical protein